MKVHCPACGDIAATDVNLYDASLKKQNFELLPVNPRCGLCGCELEIEAKCAGGEIIVLNGTCGSGKSTVAIELCRSHGYYAIDGDCVMQSAKHRLGLTKVSWDETLSEIAREIDILSLYSQKLVLSHVVLPDDIDRYIQMFEERNLRYSFILLKPDYQTAVSRCQTRTCHNHPTPEHWIRHFYETLVFGEQFVTVDNTGLSIAETAATILEIHARG